MAVYRSILVFAVFTCCSSSISCLRSSIAAAEEGDLASRVCRNTTDHAFCQSVMNSDPRIPGADRDFLAALIFRLAYSNATNTKSYIASQVKSGETSLRKCNTDYEKAIWKLSEIIGDLDSDTYYELDKLTEEASHMVRGCNAGVGKRFPPLGKRNSDMLKLLDICLVIAKLYIYNV